jgi:GNAT superfamily N-acetyltransferase
MYNRLLSLWWIRRRSEMHVSHALARRVETVDAIVNRDYARCYFRFFESDGEPAIEVAGGWASFAGLGSPLTQVFGAGMSGKVSETEFQRMEQFYASRGSAVNIEVCPYVDKSLIEMLGERGYHPVEFSHVFLRRLTSDESINPSNSGDVAISIVDDEQESLWAQTVAKGFAEGAEPQPAFVDLFSVYFRLPIVRCLVAEIEGRAIAGGLVAIHDGIAALATTSTIPAFRGRGAQAALLEARLALARKEGCEIAMITTQPGTTSHRNVERQGFRVAYSRCKFARDYVEGYSGN